MSDDSTGTWIARTADQIEWADAPYGQTAVVWGDVETGPYGSFNSLPTGTVVPPHTHSHDNQLIVVSGAVHSYRVDDDEQTRSVVYGPGSFVFEAGGVPHVLAVASDGPAVVYTTQAGALDLTLTEDEDPGA